MRADMCIPGGLLFMWGVVPSFSFAVLVAASQKPDFGTPKMETALFMGRNENRYPWRSSPSQGPRASPIWPRSDKLCHDQAKPCSFDLKAMQPWTWLVIFVKELYGKLLLSRFVFSPQLGDIKWCHTKVSHFFNFFELLTLDSGPVWNDNARQLPFAARRCGIPL
jgi:hypothetical protein